MNKSIKVKELEIGQGMPKVCVSIIGRNDEEIISAAKKYKNLEIDLVEWRADYYNEVENNLKVKNVLKKIYNILDNKPIIFTFRTMKEGGEKNISKEDYLLLNNEVITSKLTDFIDIELFTVEEEIKELITYANDNNVKVIISNHDFDKTPPKNEIIARLKKMMSFGTVIPKIAVMPKNQDDVLVLMSSASEIKKIYNRPIITMSMGTLGMISRFSGEIFGSDITFGCLNNVSAPGQINYKDLKSIISIIHNNK